MKNVLPGLLLTTICWLSALPVQALIIERFEGDGEFTTRCAMGTGDNTACEYAVAEGRAGDAGGAATFEATLGVPNTLTSSNQQAGGGTANFGGWGAGQAWSLNYDPVVDGGTLVFTVDGATGIGGRTVPLTTTMLDLSQATGIFIRASGRNDMETASLSGLTFNGQLLDGGDLLGDSTRRYLAFSDFDASVEWHLSGEATLAGGRNSAPSFQVKLTDAQVVVPEPGVLPMVAAGIVGLAWLRRRPKAISRQV